MLEGAACVLVLSAGLVRADSCWVCQLVHRLLRAGSAALLDRHAFESFIAPVQMTDHLCATCSQPFAEEDLVALNGNQEQLQASREKLEEMRSRNKKDRSSKKRKVDRAAGASAG
jgi:hypothetical protein